MSGLIKALAIVAVVAVVFARQFYARAIDMDRRWWLLPVVLAVVALREPGILDAHHHVEAAALLALGTILGPHQESSAVVLGLAGTLLVRGGIPAWRAQSFGPARRLAPAYGGDNPSAWKERV
ncbi:DUF1453 domain-containing protein [Streptomyces rubradiris]|uniref:DUF1453 domain-containing protein n=1 Tax=Streptomyces rubradiris TaxID=285531 RepID=UPI0033D636B2